MRTFVVAAAAGLTALIAYRSSLTLSLEGLLFVMMLFTATVTLGLVAGLAAEIWHLRPRRPEAPRQHCGSCGAAKTPIDVLWVCETCDRIPVSR